jgi:hypothetical protein
MGDMLEIALRSKLLVDNNKPANDNMLDQIELLGYVRPTSALDPQSPNFYDDAAAIGEALIKSRARSRIGRNRRKTSSSPW